MLLFTSGSAGEPKGVVLSHRNILANISQFRVMVNLKQGEGVLASLPFFHSFGCTVTLWFPIIKGLRAVTYPNPLDVAKNAEIVQRYGCTLFLATPTFLRAYLRKAEKEQLASVRLVITGAEKLPRAIAEAFEEKFGKQVMEGYGLTETAPVVSCNLPDVSLNDAGHTVQQAYRPGSVGKLAPGIAAQIRDPDTGAVLSLHDTGMLWLRGANIFEGYLGEPALTAEVLHDGWFRSGDLGRFDEDGFLFIEGRLSRFSKIGGEMVPHETVEKQSLRSAWPARERGAPVDDRRRARRGQGRGAGAAFHRGRGAGAVARADVRTGRAQPVGAPDDPPDRGAAGAGVRQTRPERLQGPRAGDGKNFRRQDGSEAPPATSPRGEIIS